MPKGRNRAKDNPVSTFIAENNPQKAPCIFLSHRSLDKPSVRIIAQYIAKAGIDYYLDEEDEELQAADELQLDKETVKCIQNALKISTHVLCILSDETVSSWWVPYEIGYGEREKANIASLKIKDLPEKEIPAFLRIHSCMMGLADFNAYLSRIAAPYGGIHEKYGVSGAFGDVELSSYNKNEYGTVLRTYDKTHPLFNIIDN